MTTERSIDPDEVFFEELFAEAGWQDEVVSRPDERRIEQITQRAISETIMKESTSFIFLGFGSAIEGLFSAFFGSVSSSHEDYKP